MLQDSPMKKINNLGLSLVSVLISLGLLAILMLGLYSINILAFKGFKNTSLDVDAHMELSRLQIVFSDLGMACKKNFGSGAGNGNRTFPVGATSLPASPPLSPLLSAAGTPMPWATIGHSANGLTLTNIALKNLVALSNNSYIGTLELSYNKSLATTIGIQTIHKKFPLFFHVDTVSTPGTAKILDCATTSGSLGIDTKNLCLGITTSSGGSASWSNSLQKCVLN